MNRFWPLNYVKLLLWVSTSCGLAACALLYVALHHLSKTTATPLLAGTALLAASAGWVFTNFVTLSLKVRERTFEYVREVTTKEKISAVSGKISEVWRRDQLSLGQPSDYSRYFMSTYPDGELLKAIVTLGNFFEELSVAIQLGAVDETMLRRCFDEMLRLFVDRLLNFLPSFRNNPIVEGHPYGARSLDGVFEETMWLWRRWN